MFDQKSNQTRQCESPDKSLPPCLLNKLGDIPDSDDASNATCERCLKTLDEMESDLGQFEKNLRAGSPAQALDQACFQIIERLVLQDGSTVAQNRWTPGPISVGPYILHEPLGEGGMGRVYRATHTRLRKDVAVKVLSEKALVDPASLARFEREMEAVGTVEHPNVVNALDAGTQDGITYLVMELVRGVDCSRVCDVVPQLSVSSACEIARQAAVGLQHAHDRGLVHRDVKPSNLMLTSDASGEPIVKVMDLGLAVVDSDGAEHPLTDEGQMMGTLGFMAPEQATNTSNVDVRADIYSLGATLFRMLAGTIPFSGDNYSTPVQRLNGLLNDPTPSIADRRTALPTGLAELVDQMLEREPGNRPGSMAEVATRLSKYIDDHALAQVLKTATDAGTRQIERDFPLVADTDPTAMATTMAPPRQPEEFPPRRSAGRWLVAALLSILGMVACGIVWLKQTDGTYLEIDADPSVDVAIELVEDGLTVDTLRVGKDQKEHWCKSGKYEVRLPAEARDKLTIDGTDLIVTRGKNTVVRIRRVTTAGANGVDSTTDQTAPGSTAAQTLSLDADTRTFAEWLINQKGHLGANGVWARKVSELPNEDIRSGSIVASQFSVGEIRELVDWMNRHPAWDVLNLEDIALTDECISALCQLRRLNHLNLGQVPVSDSGIRKLTSSLDVLILLLDPSEMTIAGWRDIQRTQTRHRDLSLIGSSVVGESMDVIAEIQSLRELDIWTMPVSESWLIPLSASAIEILRISGKKPIPPGFFVQLSGLKHLKTLHVRNPGFSDQHLAQFKLSPRLKTIELEETSVTAEGVSRFKQQYPEVEVIVDGTQSVDHASVDPTAPNPEPIVPPLSPDADSRLLADWVLAQRGEVEAKTGIIKESSDIPDTPFPVASVYLRSPQSEGHTNQLVEWIAKHPNCTKLILDRVGRSTLATIRKVQHLAWLELEAAGPLEDRDVLELKSMPSLFRLGLRADKLTQSGWSHIRDDLNLTELAVRASRISPEAMQTIAEIKTLNVLTLFQVPITKRLLEPLHKSPISTLFIWGEEAMEEDIGTSIARIPGLSRMSFNNLTLQDKHLRKITGPPSLRILNLGYNSKITGEGVRELLKRLPKIELNEDAKRLLEP